MEYNKMITYQFQLAKSGNTKALVDSFDAIRNWEIENSTVLENNGEEQIVFDKENFANSHARVKEIRRIISDKISSGLGTVEMIELYKKTLLFDAPYEFDSYLRYIEWDRPKNKRFYEPRRKQLLPVVNAMQDLADDKLDLLAVSEPPGIGKTTLAIFYLCWLAGRNPELQILGGSHSNEFLHGVYSECLRVIDPNGEYLWSNVFPKVKLVGTNSKDMRIDLGSPKRFQTLEFSSIGSGNAGKVRATNLLYCDDLVEGIEQALSRERMEKLWQAYSTDLRQRKQGEVVKELHIATRWSVHDVIGRLEQAYGENERAKFIRFAALDENDESNFDYPYGIGFSTEFYHEQRNIMDDVTWRALYMNEPIEREGQLYAEDQVRRFFDLPDIEPDGIYAVCDTKTTGSDFCAMPIIYQYGQDYYVADFLCENYAPDIVENNLVTMLCKYNPHLAQFESNVAGGKLAQVVQEKIKVRGSKTRITTKWTQQNKETKIQVEQPFIVSHFLFRDMSVLKGSEWKEYRTALQQLFGYTLIGKNKHDDVPDVMAQASQFVQSLGMSKVIVSKRTF